MNFHILKCGLPIKVLKALEIADKINIRLVFDYATQSATDALKTSSKQ